MAIYSVSAGNTALAADLNQYYNLLVAGTDTSTKLGIGGTSTQSAAILALPQTASGGLGFGLQLAPTLSAAANADGLYLGYVRGTIATGTFTGLTASGLLIDGGAISKTGTGTIANAYSLYVTPPTIGTNNYAAYFSGHIKSGGSTPSASAASARVSGVSITGNDIAGAISFSLDATGVGSNAAAVNVTFATSYGAAPVAVLIGLTGTGNSANPGWGALAVSATGFTLVPQAAAANGSWTVYYFVIA